ncbi:MAG: ribosomal RNA small subunit methyltransferase A [Ignavibacteriaceae bacterium]|nr:ribosomal RNA small subunit methyltransferase A [Ignavibacteriaceae bacterium]
MDYIKPLKRFGQNYLVDQNIVEKIIKELNPLYEDNIIEIGPGKGALTEKLARKVKHLTAVEIDYRVIEDLKSRFNNVNIIEGDFLKISFNDFLRNKQDKVRIVGNIPYYLTSSIIFKLIDNNLLVKDALLMVQLEVAKRIIAVKNSKEYGILSVLSNFFAETKICFKIPPTVFYPKPKVYSAIVKFTFKDLQITDEKKANFIKVVKASFGNRRKTIKNSLANSIFRRLDFRDSGIDLNLRAEQLDLKDFLKLTEVINQNSDDNNLKEHT